MTRQRHVLAATAIVLITGCASVSEAGYFWGKHAETYYALARAPSPETIEAHVAELARIIEVSEQRDLRVPPGIHAELGYWSARLDDELDPAPYYQREIALYPESQRLLERLLQEQDDEGDGS